MLEFGGISENQIFQRKLHNFYHQHAHNPGGANYGAGKVDFHLTALQPDVGVIRFELISVDSHVYLQWNTEPHVDADGSARFSLEIPAGGWYKLVAYSQENEKLCISKRFGVGEVFPVAGQSYMSAAHEKCLKTTYKEDIAVWKMIPIYGLS